MYQSTVAEETTQRGKVLLLLLLLFLLLRLHVTHVFVSSAQRQQRQQHAASSALTAACTRMSVGKLSGVVGCRKLSTELIWGKAWSLQCADIHV